MTLAPAGIIATASSTETARMVGTPIGAHREWRRMDVGEVPPLHL
jgi:hypothetical protein